MNIDLVSASLGVGGALTAASIAATVAWRIHRDRTPRLSVSTSVAPKVVVDGVTDDPDPGGPNLQVLESSTPPTGALGEGHPVVDVRLTNNGTGTANIVGCEVEVIWAFAFAELRVPRTRIGRSGAMILPPSATYMAILPPPQSAVGRNIVGSRDTAILALDEHGMRPSHHIASGDSDRFIIRLEPEPHRWTGDMSTGMAQAEDGQLAYMVKLKVFYDGISAATRVIETSPETIVSPANTVFLPRPAGVKRVIERFVLDVRSSKDEANQLLARAGITPFTESEWARIHSKSGDIFDSRSKRELTRAFDELLKVYRSGMIDPIRAIQDYLDDCALLYRQFLEEVPSESEIATIVPSSAAYEHEQLHELKRSYGTWQPN